VGKLAEAVDQVVAVGREDEPAPAPEGVGLADQPRRARGVGREDDDVLVCGDVEEAEDSSPRLLNGFGGRGTGWVCRVGVAIDRLGKPLLVVADLGGSGEPGAGVVEIDMILRVEIAILASPQLI
jgi:hypothetical protein